MGLFDKIAARLSGRALDYSPELAKVLPPGDRLLAHCQVIPGARHSDGGVDGIAATLSREGDSKIMAVTEAGLSLWDFGYPGYEQLPPVLERGIARAEVVSFADTGKTAQGGVPLARISFRDRSYFDYGLMNKPGPEFWTAVAGFAR